jgi:hypothetical protein
VTIVAVLDAIAAQRQHVAEVVSTDWPPERWLAALGERVGEICQAVMAGSPTLRAELAGLAALCGAWADAMGESARAAYDEAIPWSPDDPDMSRWLAALIGDVGQVADRVYVRDRQRRVAECLCGVVTTAVRWAAALEAVS